MNHGVYGEKLQEAGTAGTRVQNDLNDVLALESQLAHDGAPWKQTFG